MMLLEQPQSPQGLDARRAFGRVGELAGGESVLADGNRGIGCLRGRRGSLRMVVSLCAFKYLVSGEVFEALV